MSNDREPGRSTSVSNSRIPRRRQTRDLYMLNEQKSILHSAHLYFSGDGAATKTWDFSEILQRHRTPFSIHSASKESF
ncbi:hypothetical protein BofuT4_uP031620.1 [Botrytis cinerea T4]|uniref:Uncharacterized protein n=1 Tax=Botryotinia fuckeliana (strain T4) TaxID=999810 RepID=G2Y9L0_BOTF4|nr:hypothetical protein BofuT4_uP031620.1 [Botrytis cinerea T4]